MPSLSWLASGVKFAALLFLPVGHVAAHDAAFAVTYTEHATRLRADLLRNYDSVVPPRSERVVNYSKSGTDVALEIRIFKVARGHPNIQPWQLVFRIFAMFIVRSCMERASSARAQCPHHSFVVSKLRFKGSMPLWGRCA